MKVDVPAAEEATYVRALCALRDAGVPHLVGGALALHHYTGIWRNTKDLDLFLRPADRDAALAALAAAGFRVEVLAPHWLAKGYAGEMFVDLISGFGNWLRPVDESWLEASEPMRLFGLEVPVLSATDMVWVKSYVAGRERFDGADIAHLIRHAHDRIDWPRLLARFGEHWELLLVYLHYYRFVYPQARELVPRWVVEQLMARLAADLRAPAAPDHPFRGPLLDRFAYLPDIEHRGEPDPREAVAQARGLSRQEVVAQRVIDKRLVEEARDKGQP
ncbi:MAG: nucleotidyltransferase family protein [Sphaerobacter sp.]|nr:nucleotidyltransferase family protein [Sphaerobacter sp.]